MKGFSSATINTLKTKVMKFNDVVGIDFSKLKFDVYFYKQGEFSTFNNDLSGFKKFSKWLKTFSEFKLDEVLICFEHTGIYTYPFSGYLNQKGLSFCMESALQIKRSMGIVRGKNDKIDAKRIAEYAYEKREKLEVTVLASDKIMALKLLLKLRKRNVVSRAGRKASVREHRKFDKRKGNELFFESEKRTINYLTKEIKRIEKEIMQIISSDQELRRLYKLVISVKGVGFVLGANILVITDCFTRFENARKFACYAGVAPFRNQSGTSIKGASKVNHMANKSIKALLSTAANSGKQHDPELREYNRKRLKMGKNTMSTSNIISNKIVHRIFAVVKRGKPYVVRIDKAA